MKYYATFGEWQDYLESSNGLLIFETAHTDCVAISQSIMGNVNSKTFAGYDPETLLCVACKRFTKSGQGEVHCLHKPEGHNEVFRKENNLKIYNAYSLAEFSFSYTCKKRLFGPIKIEE